MEQKISEDEQKKHNEYWDKYINTSATRKSPHQQRVEQFMKKVRQLTGLPSLPSVPTVPDGKMILAQAKLIMEEVLELFEAIGLNLQHHGQDLTKQNIELYTMPA